LRLLLSRPRPYLQMSREKAGGKGRGGALRGGADSCNSVEAISSLSWIVRQTLAPSSGTSARAKQQGRRRRRRISRLPPPRSMEPPSLPPTTHTRHAATPPKSSGFAAGLPAPFPTAATGTHTPPIYPSTKPSAHTFTAAASSVGLRAPLLPHRAADPPANASCALVVDRPAPAAVFDFHCLVQQHAPTLTQIFSRASLPAQCESQASLDSLSLPLLPAPPGPGPRRASSQGLAA
jgi:hypothetical protein